MDTQDLQFKSVKEFPSLSEETTAFSGTLYHGKRLLGHAHNDGHGGETVLRLAPHIATDPALLQTLSDAAMALHLAQPETYETLDAFEGPADAAGVARRLGCAADILFDTWYVAKERKRMQAWVARQVKTHASKGFPLTVVYYHDGTVNLCPMRSRIELPLALQRLNATAEQVAIVAGAR